MSRSLGGLFVFAVVVGVLACSPGDPEAKLHAARDGHVLTLSNWAETVSPDGATRGGIFTVRVSRQGTSVELPCLTVDLVFQSAGESPREIGRETIELDLADLSALGGTKDVTRKIALPAEPVEGLAVVLHEPSSGAALRALCEAKGIPGLAQ